MKMIESDLLKTIEYLLSSGHLFPGQVLTCQIESITAVISNNGLTIGELTTFDPTEAMRHVLVTATVDDNGWIFWKLHDEKRGFFMTLEQVRATYNRHLQPNTVRTSVTHPLRINTLPFSTFPGCIGMTICPGKISDSVYGGDWERNLELDVAAINNWGADAVVTIMENQEFDLLGIPNFPQVMSSQPYKWFHLEIKDSSIPDHRFEQAWPHFQKMISHILHSGGKVLVHCRGGLGRTGLVVAKLLVEEGLSVDDAIQLVRSARPGAIETWEQESYVRGSELGRL